MKRNIFKVSLLCSICMALALVGCKADVDLNNIDTTTKLSADIALPIGTVAARIDHFLGDSTLGICIENGILTMKDTIYWERPFHKVNLSQYISRQTIAMNIYDKLSPFFYNGQIMGNDNYTIPLEFPMTLHLEGINNDESYQRLDSVLIKNASFVSNITAHNLPLEWDWIERVTIELGDVFNRPEGNTVTVYDKNTDPAYGYGADMPIIVDEFSMNLMKNRHPNKWEDYHGNVVDSCQFFITLYVKIPSSAGMITIPEDASFQYNLGVQFIDYHAVWGMFKPSSDMSSEDEVVIADSWSVWNDLKSAKLPFNNPSIDMQITTQIAGALKLDGEYLYAKEDNNTV